MLLARLFFVLKIKTTIVTDCIFFCFRYTFFLLCVGKTFLFVTSDFKAEF